MSLNLSRGIDFFFFFYPLAIFLLVFLPIFLWIGRDFFFILDISPCHFTNIFFQFVVSYFDCVTTFNEQKCFNLI